jgi:hypothetical protein
MTRIDRDEFVTACRTAVGLASAGEVEAAWHDPSACAGMTVGGLTHHLLDQIRHVSELLAEPPPSMAPIAAREHYARAEWVSAAPDAAANATIRDSANEGGGRGHREVVRAAEHLLDEVPARVAHTRTPDTVLVPWQGWALTTDDFLLTRSLELIVHSDDLAASVGLPTPDFPEALASQVLGLLTSVSVRRHGATALVRALSRPQRAPASISAF